MKARTFRLFDTLSRKVKPLELIEPGHLRFYSCGPTVYSYAHIGNFRTFLTADLVVRTAEALGWRVSYVSNITDVGHLTQDDIADAAGEDKMERALHSKEGERFVNIWDLAEHYTQSFKEDWQSMNLREPMVRPKATQHIREQIIAVEELVAKGHAYATPTGVYFRLESFPEHGKLSGNLDKEQLFTGVRDVVQDDNKEHPGDFALWKKDDKHLMQWFSPWGWGFPGWHIECSVMAMQYLGQTIDLHAGGEDLVFPHHEAEIAQSESLTGKPFSNHWMHTKFLLVEGEKMAKSKGNFYTARELIEDKGVDPLALRYALISVPYNKNLNFTLQGLQDSISAVRRYEECDKKVADALAKKLPGDDKLGAELDRLYEEALEAMCDDLNTSVALAKGFEGTRVILRPASLTLSEAESAQRFLERLNGLLGIVRHEEGAQEYQVDEATEDAEWIEAMILKRADAKTARDFALADQIRKELDAQGIELRDTPEGTIWKRKVPELA